MIHTHQTAPTQFVELTNPLRLSRFGKTGVCLSSSTSTIGTMDLLDPTVTDGSLRP